MSSIPELVMRERCATCAFRPGTNAAKDKITQLKAKLCIIAGDPFLCHESPKEAWCAGVAQVLTNKFYNGALRETGYRVKVARKLLDLINEMESTADLTESKVDGLIAQNMNEIIAIGEGKAHSAGFEKIGDDYIISHHEKARPPKDAVPMKRSEYWKLKEAKAVQSA